MPLDQTPHQAAMLNIVDKIAAAREIQARRGWTTGWGSAEEEDPCCIGRCLLLAYGINEACQNKLAELPATPFMLAAFHAITEQTKPTIVQYNDQVLKDERLVPLVYDRAEEMARAAIELGITAIEPVANGAAPPSMRVPALASLAIIVMGNVTPLLGGIAL